MNVIKKPQFNSEIIWNSKKPLFDIYFKEEIFKNRYRLSMYELNENLTFKSALRHLKYL